MNKHTQHRMIGAIAAAVALAASAHTALAGGPAGTAITYQGSLQNAGVNVSGSTNFQFRLFNQEFGGSQIGSTVSTSEMVLNGVFTADLDFGVNPYTTDSQPLWLEIVVNGQPLSRQRLTSAPFALATRGLNVGANGHVGIGVSGLDSNTFFRVRSAVNKGLSIFDFSGALVGGWENASGGSIVRHSGTGGATFWDIGQLANNNFQINNGPGVVNPALTITPAVQSPSVGARVGIGVSAPTHALQVDALGAVEPFRLSKNNGATELFSIGNSGEIRGANVGHRIGGGVGFSNVLLNLSAETWDFGLNISGGDAGKPGGGSWTNTSDERLKTNIRDLDGALDTLLSLRGVTYEYKDPSAIGELPGQRVGFIAQEAEQVIPDWVWEAKDGYKRMTIRGFEAMSVEAMRELKAENTELRERIEALESSLASAPAPSMMQSSLTLPAIGLMGLGLFAVARRRTTANN